MKQDKQLEKEIKAILKEEKPNKWLALIIVLIFLLGIIWVAARTKNAEYIKDYIGTTYIQGGINSMSRITSVKGFPTMVSLFGG